MVQSIANFLRGGDPYGVYRRYREGIVACPEPVLTATETEREFRFSILARTAKPICVPSQYRSLDSEAFVPSILQEPNIELRELVVDFIANSEVGVPMHPFGLRRNVVKRIGAALAELFF